jgi:DNA polymerase III epsilon subunit-like protein
MTDVMIDLETASTEPTAAILAIGAVQFDRSSRKIVREFYTTVDPASSINEHGLHVCGSTFLWWLEQHDSARKALYDAARMPTLGVALFELTFALKGSGYRVWGNPSAFDLTILRNAFKAAGMVPPWSWKLERCYRTVRKERDPDGELFVPPEIPHHALHDARAQALHLMRLL